MFHKTGARKKKCLTDLVKIIPFPNQNLRDKAPKTTVKPAVHQEIKPYLHKPEPKVMSTPKGKLNTSNLSIKKLMSKNEEAGEHSRIDYSNMPMNSYSIDDLKMAWRKFAFDIKSKGKETFYNALIKRDPVQRDDHEFVLEVDNQVQIDYINPILPDLLGFIRKDVKNYGINIHLELTKNPEEEVKFMTGKDKFATLARKNPNLHTLKTVFNLDIEY